MSLPLKGAMPMPAQPDPANGPSGATVADKLSGGQGISQEPAVNKTVGAVITGGSPAQASAELMKGFEQKSSRNGKTR